MYELAKMCDDEVFGKHLVIKHADFSVTITYN
jgi:hypothetical protein